MGKTTLTIEQVREEIDRVDRSLLALIAERLELAGAVRRAKSGARFWRPSREESHVRELCLLYTSPSPRDRTRSRMPSSA